MAAPKTRGQSVDRLVHVFTRLIDVGSDFFRALSRWIAHDDREFWTVCAFCWAHSLSRLSVSRVCLGAKVCSEIIFFARITITPLVIATTRPMSARASHIACCGETPARMSSAD